MKYIDDHFFEKFIHKLTSIYQKHLSMKCDKITDLYNLTILMKKTIRTMTHNEKYQNQNAEILRRDER